MKTSRAQQGFTLVELLVALFAMALLAIMGWRGLDGMTRSQEQTQARSDQVLTLQVGLAQWAADLDALIQLPQATALDWNGRVLRLTRRGTASVSDGVVVVGWTRRVVDGNGTWLRWQSQEVRTRGELEQAWQKADTWSVSAGDEEKRQEVAITPIADWQIVYFRQNAWTNAQSSADTTSGTSPNPATQGAAALPEGVRLILYLPPGQAISGTLTRDWVRPTAGGTR